MTTPTAPSAKRIAAALMLRWRQSFFLPNYTPAGWWECDVFELTKAGYFREYEIKLTRGDFFRDAEKAKQPSFMSQLAARASGQPAPPGVAKHDRLKDADASGPTRFWYVTPPGLLQLDEVPEWAGLIECEPVGRRGNLLERRPAPKIHGEPLAPEAVKHAHGVCYYRFHELRSKVR